MTDEKVCVALGGNAILKHKEAGTAEEQFANVTETCRHLAELLKEGYRIAITHGNGPQVGDILLQNEIAKGTLPPMPLDVCGAESQGMIGYMMAQCLRNEMKRAGMEIPVVSIFTQTLVDRDDPAFGAPSKPVGPFYTAMEASKLSKEKGWKIVNDAGRGYRRVVPSPQPKALVESVSIKRVFDRGAIPIAAGGGGVPVVIDENGVLRGVEAVIDKDLAAAVLARLIGADLLLILTDVKKVSRNFGKPNQEDIDRMSVREAKKWMAEGHFLPGSMGPKVQAAIDFLESGGKRAVITSLELKVEALKGKGGTCIFPD